MKFVNILAASAVAILTTGLAAQAATLSGTFNVRVVNYDTGGGQASNSIADQSNFDARYNASQAADDGRSDVFTYTGELNFFIDNLNPKNGDAETILDFFMFNGTQNPVGAVAGLDENVGNLQLSKPKFAITTLFEFTEVYSNSFDTRVTHDDGFSIYDNDVELISYANPTGIRTTPKTGTVNFSGGEFRLVYAAANGNPSKLLVEGDGISAVPLPAPALMLLSGFGALSVMRRRKKAS